MAWFSSSTNNLGATPQLLHAATACKKAGRARNAPARPATARPGPGMRDSTTNRETQASHARRREREKALDRGRSIRWNGIRGIKADRDAWDSSVARVRRARFALARHSECESPSGNRFRERTQLVLR